jgi:hypothetical protein
MFEKLSQLTAEKVAVSKWRTAGNLAKMVTRAGKTPAKLTRIEGLNTAKKFLGQGSKLDLGSQMQKHWNSLGDKFKWAPARSSRRLVGETGSKAVTYDKAPKVLYRGMAQADEMGRTGGGYAKNWSHASPSPGNAVLYGHKGKVPVGVRAYPATDTKTIGFLSAHKAAPKQRYIQDYGLEKVKLKNRSNGEASRMKTWDKIHERLYDAEDGTRQELFTDPKLDYLRSYVAQYMYETPLRLKKNPLLRTFGVRQNPSTGSGFETTKNTPYLRKSVSKLTDQHTKPLVPGTNPLQIGVEDPASGPTAMAAAMKELLPDVDPATLAKLMEGLSDLGSKL